MSAFTSRIRFLRPLSAPKLILAAALTACVLYSCSDGAPSTPPPAVSAADAPPDGQRLFVENCAVCHQLDRDATGPALKGVLARWDGNTARLHAFIRNNQKAAADGDPRAVALRQKWDAAMPLYTDFSDRDIDAILAYIQGN